MKKILIFMIILLIFTGGCAQNQPKPDTNKVKTEFKISALKGPTAMGMVKLMEENEEGISNNKYQFEIAGTADELSAKIAKNEIDIAAVPCNLASILYNKTEGKIKVAAVNTLGVLYILDTTDTIKTISDLKGKTIFTVGKGTTPEFALNYVLEQNGLKPGVDVFVEFKSEASELGSLLTAGEAEIAMLPEPYVTTVITKNDKIKITLSLTEEWDKIQKDFPLLTGALIVRNDVLENNKEAFDAFLNEYKKSIEYINSNIEDGAKLVGKYEIAPEAVAKQAIPRCNIVFVDGANLKTSLEGYLNVLFSFEPKSVGGKLPNADFYYNNK